MQILLIEADDRAAEFVGKGLREQGHRVVHAADGRAGLIEATSERFDLIILDRMLPQIEGLNVLQAIRATEDRTPVLILSALGDTDERVRGLRAGADDYLAKPFAMSELIARAEVLGRRGGANVPASTLLIGDLDIDIAARIVRRAGKRIELTAREFRILEYLARNRGQVVTRREAFDALVKRSQDTNIKVKDIAVQLIAALSQGSAPLRARVEDALRNVVVK